MAQDPSYWSELVASKYEYSDSNILLVELNKDPPQERNKHLFQVGPDLSYDLVNMLEEPPMAEVIQELQAAQELPAAQELQADLEMEEDREAIPTPSTAWATTATSPGWTTRRSSTTRSPFRRSTPTPAAMVETNGG